MTVEELARRTLDMIQFAEHAAEHRRLSDIPEVRRRAAAVKELCENVLRVPVPMTEGQS